jgi:hypothetical protein
VSKTRSSARATLDMNDSADLDKLEAGLLSSALSGRQIEELITTNRELHSVVLELKALLQTPRRQNELQSSGRPELPIPESPAETKPVILTPSEALEDFQIASISVGATNEKSALRSSSNHSKADFEHDNEQARSRHEKRRQTEILRLKTQVSYKCE